jgi:hypothetical protein
MNNLLTKETLIGAVSLGAGAVVAKVVQQKLLKEIPIPIIQTNENVQNLITLGFGILTPVLLKNAIGKGLGAGMIATSVAGLVSPLLKNAKLITGDETFMGDVLMGESDGSGTLMGASDIFSAPSTDFTGADAGEMDY